MIPQFPTFKNLLEEDIPYLNSLTANFLPYSDFNATSLHVWNIDESTKISLLNGNLVIMLRDYLESKIITSVLGKNDLLKTINQLLEYSQVQGNSQIGLLPSEIVGSLERDLHESLTIVEDRDQFDYIFNLEDLVNLDGSKYHKKRNLIKRFNYLTCNKAVVEKLDLYNKDTVTSILEVAEVWKNNKELREKSVHNDELIGLRKFLTLKNKDNYVAVGVQLEGSLIAFTLSEYLPDKYALMHFEKVGAVLPGCTEFLIKETSEILKERAILLNLEQDLGIPGLRVSKSLWRPCNYLKKYQILRKQDF